MKFWFVCKELAPESDQRQQATQDTTEVSADSGTFQEGKNLDRGKDKEEKDKEKTKDMDKEKGKDKDADKKGENEKEKLKGLEKTKDMDKEKGKEKDSDKKGENEKEKLKGLEGTNLDALLQRLPGCVSRDLIDQLTVIISVSLSFIVYYQFSYFGIKTLTMISLYFHFQVEFCYLNSKSNRKKLVRALFNVPRTSLELLPYYSRMVATLSTCMKDVSSMLLQMLEEEFNFLINKKVKFHISNRCSIINRS